MEYKKKKALDALNSDCTVITRMSLGKASTGAPVFQFEVSDEIPANSTTPQVSMSLYAPPSLSTNIVLSNLSTFPTPMTRPIQRTHEIGDP